MNENFMELLYDLVDSKSPITDYASLLYPLQIAKNCQPLPHFDEACRICGQYQFHFAEFEPEWVYCEHCYYWVHIFCDGIFNYALLSQQVYYCPFCRVILSKLHPCNENELLARDPRQDMEPKRYTGRPRRERPVKQVKEEKTQSEPPPRVDPEVLLEEMNCVIGADFYGKDIQPQQTLYFVKSSFYALKYQVLPVFRQAVLRCYNSSAKIKDIDMLNDDCVAENIVPLFFREYYDSVNQTNELFRYNKPEDMEKRTKYVVASLIEKRGGPPIDLRAYYKLFLPVVPSDSYLRERLVSSAIDALMEHIERLRFAYCKTILPEVARAALIYRDLAQNSDPSYATYNPQVLYDYFLKIFEERPEPDLSVASYLQAEKLLDKSAKTHTSPPRITRRQWFDLTTRGVRDFQGITLIRQTLLLAFVQVGLGANILDRVFNEYLTNMCIQFGVDSAKNLAVRLARHDSACSSTGAAVLAQDECTHEFADVKCLCGVPDDKKVGEKEDIQEDSYIQDWDILETPTTVVWALKLISEMLDKGEF